MIYLERIIGFLFQLLVVVSTCAVERVAGLPIFSFALIWGWLETQTNQPLRLFLIFVMSVIISVLYFIPATLVLILLVGLMIWMKQPQIQQESIRLGLGVLLVVGIILQVASIPVHLSVVVTAVVSLVALAVMSRFAWFSQSRQKPLLKGWKHARLSRYEPS